MYYASSLTVLGGLHNTPLRSLMSKIVEPTEFGKIFTLTGVAQSISTLITGSFFQEIYVETEASFPGLMYLIGAGIQFLILVYTLKFDNARKKVRSFSTFLFC